MNVELLPDSRHYADELLALRRDNAALKVALRDSNQARDSLRRELDDTRRECADKIERAADQMRRITQAMREVVG
jgi:hypothetical protein